MIKRGVEVLAENSVTIMAGVDDLFPVKTATHIPSTEICTECYLSDSWGVIAVDHVQVIGVCVDCYNNDGAQGKPANNIVTTTDCGTCHLTSVWLPTIQ